MVWVKRGVVIVAGVLILGLVATTITGAVMVRRSFPTTSGELTVPGLVGPVQVLRDRHGVPTIVARSSDDLFRAQGFVHAQDRFWEMDFRRHVTAGRVSELFGADRIETDRFVRTLGWRRTAEAELDLLSADTLGILEAYADGVNVWMDQRSGSQLSFEHGLLPVAGAPGYRPEPWTAADSVAWLKAMAWDLRSNLEDELLRARLLGTDLGDGRSWEDLFPDFPADRHPVILPQGGAVEGGSFVPAAGDTDAAGVRPVAASLDTGTPGVERALAAAQQALTAAPQMLGDGTAAGLGSNSWVVAPQRSTTGTALLANDPHLGPSQPSLWYQVGLQCRPVGPDCPYRTAGFSFSGVPGIVIGHNVHVGWGFTNLGPDVADLVIERIDGDSYLTEDGWEPMEIREETIRVAGDEDVTVTIRETRNGPLFSDVSGAGAEVAEGLLGDEAADGAGDHAVALRWVALDARPTMDALPALMRAEDWETFRHAASMFEVPAQNLVYADVDGNIGYQAPGRIPVRRSGDGTLPLPGWTGEAGWDRFLDFEELPWTFNPPAGYLATANQPVLPPGSEPLLSQDFSMGHRAARIVELVEQRDQLSPDDLSQIQMDAHNANGAALVPVLREVADRGDERVTAMQEVLAAWEFQDEADSAGGAAFNVTWRHLLALTFHDELPEWAWPSGAGRWWEVVRGLVDEPDSPWWDDASRPGTQGRDDILHAAIAAAHDELTDTFSDDPDDWQWGELHTLTLTHGTFGTSGIRPVERLFNRGPLETSGGSDIVNATGWAAHHGYEVVWVPSMRMVLDMGDLDAGRWIHLTGQSGRPFHRHYTDQAEPWRDGELNPITFSERATDATTVDRLDLVPLG